MKIVQIIESSLPQRTLSEENSSLRCFVRSSYRSRRNMVSLLGGRPKTVQNPKPVFADKQVTCGLKTRIPGLSYVRKGVSDSVNQPCKWPWTFSAFFFWYKYVAGFYEKAVSSTDVDILFSNSLSEDIKLRPFRFNCHCLTQRDVCDTFQRYFSSTNIDPFTLRSRRHVIHHLLDLLVFLFCI